MRIRIMEALLDKRVFGIELGPSPRKYDIYVYPEELRGIIRKLS